MSSQYQSMQIHPALTPYVKSIDVELFHINNNSSVFSYRVLPDFSVVLGFQYSGSLYLLEQEKKIALSSCGISGLQTQHKVFQPESVKTKTILVKLYPWSINIFFKEDAYHFSNQALSLREIIDSSLLANVEEQLSLTVDINLLSNIVQDFLVRLLNQNHIKKLPSPQIINIARHISCFDKVNLIEKLANQHGMSKRHLERQFKSVIGLSPKQFLRLSQFRKAFEYVQSGVDWERCVENLNYYDQAHFINSFKEFSGLTPTQLKIIYK